MKKLIITGITVLVLILIVLQLSIQPTSTFLIPEGYTGEVKIIYEQEGYPALERKNNRIYLEIPSTGVLLTSSENKTGPVRFYYVNSEGDRTEIKDDLIHSLYTSKNPDGLQTLNFTVGTKSS
ncbi:DUF6843 domain-containing protein [Paenibacillus sp. IITD108]|uniref:DUF6843 domain-containing protein n=1 Tax=Paenibacillus sp. IITD108 TaxID=3116649 RepID=UPI002F407266